MHIIERFRKVREERILISDGGMGTLLQNLGLKPGHPPETMLLDNPEAVGKVHREYYLAGARMITTNSFGASPMKLAQFGLEGDMERINTLAVRIARKSVGEDAFIAASIGPSGALLQPMGPVSMPELTSMFRSQAQVLKDAGADFAILETMSDIGEMLCAARACADIDFPFIASMTFENNLRSLSGSPPEVTAVVMEPFNPVAIGSNCGMGPDGMVPVIKEFAENTHFPIIAQPNAGLPELVNGRTVFRMNPQDFASVSVELAQAGCSVIGGCCGTTPDHIALTARAISGLKPVMRNRKQGVAFASRTRAIVLGPGMPFGIIGERVNPTGRKKLSAQLAAGDFSMAKRDAGRQLSRGAALIDVNVGIPDVNEKKLMEDLVRDIQGMFPDACLSVDSNDAEVLSAGIQQIAGRPLLNSINGEEKTLSRLLPLVKKTGVNFIALAMDERGIPGNAAQRIEIIHRILDSAEQLGIDKSRILVDCLVFTVGSQPVQPLETLKTVRYVTETLGCATVLGVSNVSFGLPERAVISSTYLAMALANGLSAGIINPLSNRMMQTLRAAELLLNRDPGAGNYLQLVREIADAPPKVKKKPRVVKKPTPQEPSNDPGADPIASCVIHGSKSEIIPLITQALDSGISPGNVLNNSLVPAIQLVGDRYGKGELYLPQLIMAGETMRRGVDFLKPQLRKRGEGNLHLTPVLICTVANDIHDIGKNIVSIILENSGFNVIDLGKNVKTEVILQAIPEHDAKLVGLSALMTTTLPSMEDSVLRIREKFPEVKTMVGGAVVTRKFADRIGAHGYAREAVDAGTLGLKLLGLRK